MSLGESEFFLHFCFSVSLSLPQFSLKTVTFILCCKFVSLSVLSMGQTGENGKPDIDLCSSDLKE